MRELLPTIDAWAAEGVGAGRATVIRTFGTAPRPAGAVLLRADDGRIAGSVSGGCVEGAAAEEIERARRTGRSRVIRYGISDEQAWDVGLACGATIDVLIEPHIPWAALEAARASVGSGRRASAVVTALPPDSPPPTGGQHQPGEGAVLDSPMVIDEASPDGGASRAGSGTAGADESVGDETAAELAATAWELLGRGESGTVELAGRQHFIEAFQAPPRLVIVGAVEIARALVAIARPLGYETVVIDGRAAFATHERFPDADRLIVGWPDEVADEIGLGPADALVALTHDPKFDEPAIAEALRRGCRYVGAIGSAKTQADRRRRLATAGVTDDDLARLRGPVGLDLGGRAPGEVALSIMAEIVADRYGGSGRPMISRAVALA